MKQRILAIEPGVEDNTGAGLRVNGLLGGLGEDIEVHRWDVQELCAGLTPESVSSERWRFLVGHPAWAVSYAEADRIRIWQRLEDRIREIKADLLWLAHGRTAAKVGLDSRSFKISVPVIVDAYDLLWTALERRLSPSGPGKLKGWRRRRAALEVGRARRFEHRLYAAADQVWVCSELDRRRLYRDIPADSVQLVPNFFDPPGALGTPEGMSTASAEQQLAVFVGTLGYYPNRDGMEWLLESVWPKVIEQRPSARLWVVGRWPDWATRGPAYEQKGVEVKGFVDDLDAVWAKASLLVCPLRIGSGTRIKILEAWSRRVPVVSTSVGIEGLEAQTGVHARVVDIPDLFAQAMLELMDDAAARQKMADGGYQLWNERYTLDKVCSLAAAACRSLLS